MKKNHKAAAAGPKKTTTDSYFSRLQFDPKMSLSLVAKYIANLRLVILLVVTVILMGLVSYFSLPKRLNPEIEIPIVSIVTVLPGASPEDVESLVTIPLENKLQNASGLDVINSVSSPNVSVITMQFFSQVKRDKAKDDVQALVDQVSDLPDDAQSPQVAALDFEDTPIWTFAVSSSSDVPTLMNFAQHMEERLERLTKVDRVETAGFEEEQVEVQVSPSQMRQYGLNPFSLSQAVQKGVSSYPAGNVESEKNSFSVTINPTLTTLEDIRQLPIQVNGTVLRLGEIATVSRQPKSNQAIALLQKKGQPVQRSVTFYVYKTSSTSIDEAGKQVEAEVEEILAERPGLFSLTTIVNTSEDIQEQFSDLLGEFRTTILLVFACLLLFLGFRQAAISSLTVPLTFLSAFVLMRMVGMSINFLSLFAFLLALGLLVDDTIVVVSAMTAYSKTGKFSPLETGLMVWRDTIVPIWSTTITTIWSFVPLLLSTGIIGEFIKPIPIVVTITMVSSTAIAVLITLPIMLFILKPSLPHRVVVLLKGLALLATFGVLLSATKGNPLLPMVIILFIGWLVVLKMVGKNVFKRIKKLLNRPFVVTVRKNFNKISNHGLIDLTGFERGYYNTIIKIISSKSSRMKVIFAIVAYALISFSLLPLGLVKNEFFPKSDQETLYVDVSYPAGTRLESTIAEAEQLLPALAQTEGTEFVVAEIGKSLNSMGGRSNSTNSVLFSIHLPESSKRDISSIELAQQLRDAYKDYNQGEVSVVEESGGPPAGSDIQIQLLGENLAQLDAYAEEVSSYLKQQPGVTNVQKSVKTGTSQVVFVPDQARLTQAGISVDQIGLMMRMYASGFTLDSVNWEGNGGDKKDIVFKLSDQPDLPNLSSLTITNQFGSAFPIDALGTWEARPNPTQITRENGNRTMTVSATSVGGYSVSEQNKQLLSFVEKMGMKEGYGWATGGVNEENQKSVTSILQAMGVAAILILVTMVVQFGSFRQAFIVLTVIPLAVSSVFLIFALTGTPLSFPALIGVLSLFGIVVTNSMFIVDKINLNQRQGMPLKEAIADAGSSRLEPIILTKLCTVLGLLPITIADPLWRGLGGAIISGILVSSTIMLLFIPAVYYEFFSRSKPSNS